MNNNNLKPNSRYTLPSTRSQKSYRKFVRANKYPKYLERLFS